MGMIDSTLIWSNMASFSPALHQSPKTKIQDGYPFSCSPPITTPESMSCAIPAYLTTIGPYKLCTLSCINNKLPGPAFKNFRSYYQFKSLTMIAGESHHKGAEPNQTTMPEKAACSFQNKPNLPNLPAKAACQRSMVQYKIRFNSKLSSVSMQTSKLYYTRNKFTGNKTDQSKDYDIRLQTKTWVRSCAGLSPHDI